MGIKICTKCILEKHIKNVYKNIQKVKVAISK